MKKAKISKSLIIILLVAFPTTILFGSIITTVHAGSYVPEEHVNNEWHWNVNEDELLMYELEVIMANATSLEETLRVKDLMIFNITGFENITMDNDGLWDPGQNVSQVNTDLLRYNLTLDDLQIWKPYPQPYWPIGAFGYNFSHSDQLKITGLQHYPPLILPLNGTNNLEVDILTNVLNETSFYPAAEAGRLNYFDYSEYNVGENSTYFSNSADNYFINATYYGDNGTLKCGEGFIKLGPGTNPDYDILYNMSIKRVFDYNLTDEIEWGFKEGDSLYYGMSLIGNPFMEMKLDIVGFNDTEYDMPTWYGGFMEPMVIQDVLVNVSYWNDITKTYVLDTENQTMASANNFYPINFNVVGMFIIPNNTKLEDLRFIVNNNTQKYYPSMFPYDLVYLYEDPNGKFISELNATASNMYSYSLLDMKDGVMQYLIMINSGVYGQVFYRKNMTVITNPVEANDVWLYSDIIGNCQAYINFTYPGVDVELYWAALPVNPMETNATFPYEIPNMPLYLDLYSNNTEALDDYPINMTIYYDDSKLSGLLEENLVPSFFNTTTQAWKLMPDNFYSIDTSLNRIDIYGFEYVLDTYQFFAIGYTIKPPWAFTLTSTAEDPDDDGIFTLSWDTSLGATNYTGYRHSGYITEINSTVTEIFSETTNLMLPCSYTDGTYYFIVLANNTAGSILSNCIKVIVQIPAPPGAFTLTSNAGDPDNDGTFTLSWGSSVGVTNYSVYQYSGYITAINSSVTQLISETTNLTLPLSGYTNGTYYFIVIATNNVGSTLSNCIKVDVQIPPEEPDDDDDVDGFEIPGYDLFFFLMSIAVVSAISIKKFRKRVNNI